MAKIAYTLLLLDSPVVEIKVKGSRVPQEREEITPYGSIPDYTYLVTRVRTIISDRGNENIRHNGKKVFEELEIVVSAEKLVQKSR